MANPTPLTADYIKSVDPMLTTDLAHWAEYGIGSVEQFNDYLDISCACNVFKSENGFGKSFDADEARAYLDRRS